MLSMELQTVSSTVKEICRTAAAAGLRPDPLLTVSEWADEYRILSTRASAEPGPWRTSRTPYLKAIMDCLSPSSLVERVVFMKGAQVGATECGNNWIGYVVHQAPGPMMAVQPTVEMAKRNSKQRVDPLIEESDILRSLVRDPRSRDSGNTILSKEFPGGVLVMTGANSAVGLRSMAARYLFLDEVDGYPGDVEAVSRDEGRTEDFEVVYWNILGGVTFAAVSFRFAILTQEWNSISLGASDFLWSHVLGVHRLCPCARKTRDKNLAIRQERVCRNPTDGKCSRRPANQG